MNCEKNLIFEKVEKKLEQLFGTSLEQINSSYNESNDVLKENEVLSVLIEPEVHLLDSIDEKISTTQQVKGKIIFRK